MEKGSNCSDPPHTRLVQNSYLAWGKVMVSWIFSGFTCTVDNHYFTIITSGKVYLALPIIYRYNTPKLICMYSINEHFLFLTGKNVYLSSKECKSSRMYLSSTIPLSTLVLLFQTKLNSRSSLLRISSTKKCPTKIKG